MQLSILGYMSVSSLRTCEDANVYFKGIPYYTNSIVNIFPLIPFYSPLNLPIAAKTLLSTPCRIHYDQDFSVLWVDILEHSMMKTNICMQTNNDRNSIYQQLVMNQMLFGQFDLFSDFHFGSHSNDFVLWL